MSGLTTANALDQAGIGLRRAIERGDLEEAQKLLFAYGRRVQESLKTMAGDDRRITALANETKRMFDWAHEAVSAGRAETAAELDGMRSNLFYAASGPAGLKTWELDG